MRLATTTAAFATLALIAGAAIGTAPVAFAQQDCPDGTVAANQPSDQSEPLINPACPGSGVGTEAQAGDGQTQEEMDREVSKEQNEPVITTRSADAAGTSAPAGDAQTQEEEDREVSKTQNEPVITPK